VKRGILSKANDFAIVSKDIEHINVATEVANLNSDEVYGREAGVFFPIVGPVGLQDRLSCL